MNAVERYSDLLLDSIIVFAVLLVVAMIILAATLLLCALYESATARRRSDWLGPWFLSLLLPLLV